jgi:hypothetical protein
MLLFKWFNFVLCLAALATAGLGQSILIFILLRSTKSVSGIYGSGLSIRNAYKTAAATSFGCAPPV